jgi:tripartite-type tricarboxylate transporter receptor subunit TctC
MDSRRLASGLLVLAALAAGAPALAQEAFPSRPIRIVTPFPPGSSDVIARRLGEFASRSLGQPIVVETRPGGNGTVATRAIARVPADGYTLLLGTNSTHSASVHLFKDPGYDPIRDFTPITRFTINPLLLVVHADLPARNVAEFISYARARPGKLSYATGNSGSLVAAQLLRSQAGIDAVAVNYPGNAKAVPDFVSGRIDFMVTDPMIVKSFAEEGKLRILGVTSRQVLPTFPEVKPLAELGMPDFEYVSWIGLFAPAGLPAPITRQLHQAFTAALAEPEIGKFLAGIGMIAAGNTPEEFARYVSEQTAVWGRLTRDAGLKPE